MLISDRGRIVRHIVPLLGRKSVASVTRNDIDGFMHDIATGKTASRQKTKPRGLSVVRGGRGVASRSVGLLGAIFTYAIRKGLRFDNPAHGIVRFADGRRQRRLTDDEYRQLGRALKTAEVWKPAIAATWLMILTGWRRGEVLGLRWSEVDLPRRTARLADTKTGASLRPLSELACMVIQSQPMIGDMVFASRSGEIDRRLSEDVAADRQAGWSAGGHHAPCAAPQLRQSCGRSRAIASRPSPACSGTRPTASPAGTSIPPMPCCWQQPMPWRVPP